jgi:threonine dehydrogenase-like Zn-dependent dehydrogenase
MKAALLYDGDLRVEETADPAADGWALVSARAAGVCGTELHFLDGMIPPPTTPFQLGHEAAGIVLEAPPGSAVQPGDRVAVGRLRGRRPGACGEPRAAP